MATVPSRGYSYDGEGGAGGKMRRRPPRSASAATPYARPPATVRAATAGGGGLLSRLVDPAYRILSSVLRKPPPQPSPPLLLPEPPSDPEEDLQGGEEICEVTCVNPSTGNPDTSIKGREDTINCSDDNNIPKLEQLLEQKTFTIAEFQHLAELLRLRTVESDASKPAINIDENVVHTSEIEKETRGSKLPIDFSTVAGSIVLPENQAASPAELAKAFMGSRTSKVSPLRLRLQSPGFLPGKATQNDAAYTTKPSALSLVPSSTIHASALPDHPESSYMTPRRSAIYRMSSSPYFKGSVFSKDASRIASSSYQMPSSIHTLGRQVLKRKSVLNNESGSVGPIRRMRQRYNMMSPLLATLPSYRGYPVSHANKLENVIQHSAPMQKHQCLDKVDDGNRQSQNTKDLDNGVCNDSFTCAPPQSSEMATKILKQLDTLVPLQKEGAMELKSTAMGVSQLMPRRHGQNDVEDTDSSKFINANKCYKGDGAIDSLGDVGNRLSQSKEGSTEGNIQEPSASGVQVPYGVNNINGAVKFAPVTAVIESIDNTIANPLKLVGEKSDFQKSSPKGSLELDDHNITLKEDIAQAYSKIEKSKPLIMEHGARNSEMTNKEKPPKSYSRALAPSSLILSSEVDKHKKLPSSSTFISSSEANKRPSSGLAVADIHPGFTFPVPATLSVHSQPPPTPTMASPPSSILSIEKQHSHMLAAATTPSTVLESVLSTTKSASAQSPLSNRCGKRSKAGDPFNISKNIASSEIPPSAKPSVFSFANPKPTNLSNSLAHTSSLNLTISSAAGAILSDRPVSSLFSSDAVSATTTSTHHLFNFGSGTSVTSQAVAAPPLQKSRSVQAEEKPIGATLFGTQNSATVGTLAFSNRGSSSSTAGSSMFSSAASPSVIAPSLVSSGTGNSNADLTVPSQPSSANSFAAHDKSRATPNFGTTAELTFGVRSAGAGSGILQFPQSSASQFSSFSSTAFNLGSSASSFVNSSFGSASNGSSLLSSNSAFSFPNGLGSCSSVTSRSSLPVLNADFGSSSALSPLSTIAANLASSALTSFTSPSVASGSSSFTFSSSLNPVFSFSTTSPTTLSNPSSARPLFSKQNSSESLSMGNDQMNVEHNMTSNSNQSSASVFPSFGLPCSSSVTPVYSTPATPATTTTSGAPPIFQFGQQSPVPPSPLPFQPTSNADFTPGAGFSVGTGGGDKSGRKFIKVRRDRARKK